MPWRRPGTHAAGHLAPPGSGQEPGRRGPGRADRAVPAARRATRWCWATAARRLFWDLAVASPDGAAQRPRQLRGVLGQVRRRCGRSAAPGRAERGHRRARIGRRARGSARRRRLRLGPQRDLDRRPGPGAAGRRSGRGRPGGGRRHLRRRRVPRWTSPPPTPTTSRRRRASAPRVGCGWRCCSPAAVERAERIAAVRPLDPGDPQPDHGDHQLPAEPDPEHPGHRHPVPAARPARRG